MVLSLETFADFGDNLFRVPFVFFIDLILSKRVQFAFDYGRRYSSWAAEVCPNCFRPSDDQIALLLAIGLIVCLLTSLLYLKSAILLALATATISMSVTASIIYSVLLNLAASPCHFSRQPYMDFLIRCHFAAGLLLALAIFVFFTLSMSPYQSSSTLRKSTFLFLIVCAVPQLSYLPIRLLQETTLTTRTDENRNRSSMFTCPAWIDSLSYSNHDKLIGLSHYSTACNGLPSHLDCITSINYHQCVDQRVVCPYIIERPITWTKANSVPSITLSFHTISFLLPFVLAGSYLLLLCVAVLFSPLFRELLAAIHFEIQLYDALGLMGFVSFHWTRINVHKLLAFLWVFKLALVVAFGPSLWQIVPNTKDSPSSFNTSALNVSFLQAYIESDSRVASNLKVRPSTAGLFLNRLLVGSLVHGSETWLVVFGAAAFFGSIAGFLVRGVVLLLDPSGEQTAELIAAAPMEAVDQHDWNAIEDPAVARDQNDAFAVEVLESTGLNCAVVFLFLAFQYDLPTLPLIQRICCSIYGIIVIGITCIQPIHVLLKSLLLHLGIPGRSTPWKVHLRLLSFCALLFFLSFCILAYVPDNLVDTNQEVRDSSNNDGLSIDEVVVPRFGSSIASIQARQLRILLYGYQILLSLTVTILEYAIYQISQHYPDWTGFQPSLFWVKIVSSVLDYLISLLSFIIVCWLAIYDSVGICRLFIICCYFYFVLYPSARQAFLWIRWRLFSSKRLNDLAKPTPDELDVYGDSCPICYSEMTPDTAKVTRCGHFYHTDCLSMWMRRQQFCPICHADLLSTRVTNRRQAATSFDQGDDDTTMQPDLQ